ncbi:MAG: NADH-quinone oxidoreductase subunit C, partial [Paraglaciecola polaris]|uniref:NADH-quinone oxidoreductase subunit C n=1 Tax=Paraglaciecola polaris TaxID=222814 RepID=UPI0030020DFC
MQQVSTPDLLSELQPWLANSVLLTETTADQIPTFWVAKKDLLTLCDAARYKLDKPFTFLFDLTAIDETTRQHMVLPQRQDFTVVYLLRSYERNQDVRIKVALDQNNKALASVTSIWPNANWYEREVWDLFGIKFDGHPCLRRIMMPTTWLGHPLCKTHPARATEI